MDDRGQAAITPMPAVAAVIVVTTLIVGGTVYQELSGTEFKEDICREQFGENASWVNDSDDTFDCRHPNGTEIEDIKINVTSGGNG